MSIDIRTDAAKYYDYNPNVPNDIPFYIEHIPSPDAQLLELGCGTGRVTIPLAQYCHSIHAIDLSEAMISLCRDKVKQKGIPPAKIRVETADITAFNLVQKFDLITAPFRVFQNIETDEEVNGLFECVSRHLAPQGSCILNVFNPNTDRETLLREWCTDHENLAWEVITSDGRVTCSDRRPRLDAINLILYPELIYRSYKNEVVVDEAILEIVMRCYYPAEFVELITDHGFQIINKWGGYAGELYGQGPEMVVEFGLTS